MKSMPPSIKYYYLGMAETYAETVSKTSKPLAVLNIIIEVSPKTKNYNKHIIDLKKQLKEKANQHRIKFQSKTHSQKLKTEAGEPFVRHVIDLIYYKEAKILREYLRIIKTENINDDYHRRLGKIFGYTPKAIESFIKKQHKSKHIGS
jgi:hypothetical protein